MTMVTPRSGFDLEYYLGRAGEKTAGGYYLNAAQEGEPPGRWFGKGAEALGFTDGQVVERDPYLAAYQQTDPVTGEKLGRAPNGYKRFSQIFAAKLAAEPHATFERRLELEREAGQEARRSPVYTDLTVAHNKSVSVLHASFREQARRAHLAGDSARGGGVAGPGGTGAGDLARGQPRRAGIPPGACGVHPHRLPRPPDRWGRAGPVGARRAAGDDLAAGHQPGRGAARPLPQRDRAHVPDAIRWGVARGGHDGAAQPAWRHGRDRGGARPVGAGARVRRPVGGARRRHGP